ncbi:MAG: hypothetical protein DRN04_12800 [Thermoprotei archaeon]|nr:MAG: hypothetical protein DRN04_12800 [Thermoprotei archaeon]
MARISYDERWLQGKILIWMNEIIKKHNLPFEAVEQEVKISTPKGLRRYPDLIVWYKKPDKIACLIELKVPTIDVYSDDLVNDALQKATLAGIPFFATWNLNKLVLWETFKPGTSLLDRRLKHWDVVDVKLPVDVERPEIERAIKAFILEFLTGLASFYERKLPRPKVYVLPKLYPDEIMVLRLRSAVDALYIPVSLYILKKKEEDPDFLSKVAEWFVKQGWIFSDSEEDYDRLARQTVYLLINKLLFYNVLRSKFRLEPIDVSGVTTGEELRERLQRYFNTGIRLGYGIIFAADFLETIPIPDEAVDELKRLIIELNKYDFSRIGYDIIGKVFEKLIPKTERHKLGQYFTRTDVVDLILGFTIKHPDDKVLDPACGSGTFLVRAYQRKKYLAEKLYREGKYDKPYKPHSELINELWGIDIAKFPAHLSEINLVIRNLEALENRPNIVCRDFFEMQPGTRTLLYELAYKIPDIHKEELEVEFPRDFDAVVTNPPYTRQEEMEDIFMGGYKDRLRELVKKTYGIDVGKRSSIYTYFFYHGGSFVKEGGRIGLITSNSWLDVDFGKHLQEYFLKNFKIIAIIESKVERWFEDADIITAITILEKCNNKKERDENLVKFVQLKVPLRRIIPEAEGIDERTRWEIIDRLVKLIEETKEYYEDDNIRIFPKKQAELWDEGYNDEENRYTGSKWGKYIRAPQIFFNIILHGKNSRKLIPLGKVASIRRGFTTGANEFFYKSEDEIIKLGLEREFWMHPLTKKEFDDIARHYGNINLYKDINGELFKRSQFSDKYTLEDILINNEVYWMPNYLVRTPRELDSFIIHPSELKYRVLLIHKDKADLMGTNILKYIREGERKNYASRPTCKSRKRWYELNEIKARIFWIKSVNDTHFTPFSFVNLFFDQRVYAIIPFKDEYFIPLVAFLNSTVMFLFKEVFGRVNLGEGALDTAVYELFHYPVIDPNNLSPNEMEQLCQALYNLIKRKPKTVFEEILGRKVTIDEIVKKDIEEFLSEVSLSKVSKDRLVLDRVVMRVIGLDNDEKLLELYKGVLQLVLSRIKRAKSVKSKNRKTVIDAEAIANSIVKRASVSIKRFPEDYLSREPESFILELKAPKTEDVVIGSDLGGFYVKAGGRELYRGWDQFIAEYIYYSILCGKIQVRVPADEKLTVEAVSGFKKDLNRLKGEINRLVEITVPDAKIREEVRRIALRKMFDRLRS